MPRVIAGSQSETADLEETIAALAVGFDPREDESTLATAAALERLANNRDFLGDLLIDHLREGGKSDLPESSYGPQAIVLSPVRGGCFLRANIWPSARETCVRRGGPASFVYGMPHDHNFDFLTVGYFGPGYRSDYYTYDYDRVAGYCGESARLRFVGRSALEEGRLLHYRAHLDVHAQIPPEETSVSLNVMHFDPTGDWCDQYGFDLAAGTVERILNPSANETFLRCAVAFGAPEALDLAECFGRDHPSTRMRLACFEARAMLLDRPVDQDALWRTAERSGDRMLAAEAHRRRAALEILAEG